jgi:hypothetical protein
VDCEFDIDVLGMFRPRFVDAPVSEFFPEVTDAQIGSSLTYGMNTLDASAHVFRSSAFCDHTRERGIVAVADSELPRIVNELIAYLPGNDECGVDQIPECALFLSRWQWSCVYAGLADEIGMNSGRALRLLRTVNASVPLAEFVLLGALPALFSDANDGVGDGDTLRVLVEVAAQACRGGGWKNGDLRRLMDEGSLCGEKLQNVKCDLAVCVSLCQ